MTNQPNQATSRPSEGGPFHAIQDTAARIRQNVQKVIVGKGEAIDLALTAILCEGHALIEDVPGTGKTTLAKAVATSLGCSFQRIQFTPDLLPSDITGISVFNQKTGDFEYRPGPILSQVVLADEINRATPRTQSALLEAMQERQITADGITHLLPRPHLILATENPVELEGTFPLPEAQLDRFLLRIPIGYPTETEENGILERFRKVDPLTDLAPVTGPDVLKALIEQVRDIRVEQSVQHYMVALVRATRQHTDVALGASPRAALALYRAAQAWAAIHGSAFVTPDDVKFIATRVLTHRILISPQMRVRGRTAEDVINVILESVPVPVSA
jgi:MoxR-like ATPase